MSSSSSRSAAPSKLVLVNVAIEFPAKESRFRCSKEWVTIGTEDRSLLSRLSVLNEVRFVAISGGTLAKKLCDRDSDRRFCSGKSGILKKM